ncbi:MAG: polysaccharide ABC transporter ATP-binding protein [Candidatus Sericytochromatia bacterium]|nr:polysaccharide ABC transporter ATP-binding protein [Candidatus Sericytochromatia bacterium]
MAAIAVEGVWKAFARPAAAPRTLKEWLLAAPRGRSPAPEPGWVLQDVDLAVPAGAAVGLVGDNGSGKSTLLKLLAGILGPTRGRLAVQGRVSALLELGAGFHPDFTGRENVFLNGALLGLSRREVAARLEAIVAFAELEDAIDAPVKTYSSGMYMRLAFAVATHVDPEVLLVDEVLAVGDARFQRKCLARLRRFREAGVTVLLVSHDASAVRALCDRAVWLAGGRVQADGEAATVLERYAGQAPPGPALLAPAAAITGLRVEGGTRTEAGAWRSGEAFQVGFDLALHTPAEGLDLTLKVFKSDGVTCYTHRTALGRLGGRSGRVTAVLPSLLLLSGEYTLEVGVGDGPLPLAVHKHPFRIHCDADGEGIAPLACEWSLAPEGAPWPASS